MLDTDGFTSEFYKQEKNASNSTQTLKKEVKETDPNSYKIQTKPIQEKKNPDQ